MSVRIEILILLFSKIIKRKVRFYSKEIGLSVYPLKHLGFSFRVGLETLVCKVVRVSLKLLCNLNLMNKIIGD